MTSPSIQFNPKRQQYNTGPNDTLKTYMPIFREKRNSFRASVWPDLHIAKWVAGGAPPEGVFNKHDQLQICFAQGACCLSERSPLKGCIATQAHVHNLLSDLQCLLNLLLSHLARARHKQIELILNSKV
jgi:hypothetical protein